MVFLGSLAESCGLANTLLPSNLSQQTSVVRQKASDVHQKASDARQKASDVHQKPSDGKLMAMETVASMPKIVSAEEYLQKPFTLHFLDINI